MRVYLKIIREGGGLIMAMREYPLYTFKMILLGEPGSGKTCLFHRIVYDHYRDGGTYEDKIFSATPGSGGFTSLQYENHTKEVELSGNIRVNVCNKHTDACIIIDTISYGHSRI